jgi:transcriptional regulator
MDSVREHLEKKDASMHVTELTEELLNELKEYVEITPEGHILTKKINSCRWTKAKIGERRGAKRKQGRTFAFTFSKTTEKLNCRARDVVWIFNNGTYDLKMKVQPKNGDLFDDRLENLELIKSNNGRPPKSKDSSQRTPRDEVLQEKKYLRAAASAKKRESQYREDAVEAEKEEVQLRKTVDKILKKIERSKKAAIAAQAKAEGARIQAEEHEDAAVAAQEQEDTLIKLRNRGLTKTLIAREMQTSPKAIHCAIESLRMSGKIKPFFNPSILKTPVDMNKEQVGIYVIYAASLDPENHNSKAYIGSSVGIQKRLGQHFSQLERNKHYNKEMQECFNSDNYVFKSYLVEECKEGEELGLETEYINRFNKGSLFNTWSQPPLEEIKPYLDKVKHLLDDETLYTVDENGCWNWNKLNGGGYSREIQRSIKGKVKYVKPHRLSYYKTYGEYPELIRHMCDNRACVSPDHLKKGNHRQNSLDKSRQFRKDFEHWWIHYKGDVEKLTNHFGFKNNQNIGSSQIYYWEKKIGLREKYPDICPNRGLNKPTERSIGRHRKRLETIESKEARNKFVESLRKEVISLRRRHGATQTELAAYLNLTSGEVRSLVKDLKSPIQENMELFQKIFKPYADRGIYYDEQHHYISEMIEDFPEHKWDIEHHFAVWCVGSEPEGFSMFQIEFHRNRVSRAR